MFPAEIFALPDLVEKYLDLRFLLASATVKMWVMYHGMPHVVLTWPSERVFIWKSRLVLEIYSACGSFSLKTE